MQVKKRSRRCSLQHLPCEILHLVHNTARRQQRVTVLASFYPVQIPYPRSSLSREKQGADKAKTHRLHIVRVRKDRPGRIYFNKQTREFQRFGGVGDFVGVVFQGSIRQACASGTNRNPRKPWPTGACQRNTHGSNIPVQLLIRSMIDHQRRGDGLRCILLKRRIA